MIGRRDAHPVHSLSRTATRSRFADGPQMLKRCTEFEPLGIISTFGVYGTERRTLPPTRLQLTHLLEGGSQSAVP